MSQKKLTITVTGGDAEDRVTVMGFLQASLRRMSVIPSMEVSDPTAVMTRAADEFALSQDLGKFSENGIQITISDETSAKAAAEVLVQDQPAS